MQIVPLCPNYCSPAFATSLPPGTSRSLSFLPALSGLKGHIPEARVPSLQPAPRHGACIPPAMGQELPPHFPLGCVFLTDNAEKSLCAPCPTSFSSSGILPSLMGGLQLFISLLAGVSRPCRLLEVRLSVGCLCFGISRDPPRSGDRLLSQALDNSCIRSLLNLWM